MRSRETSRVSYHCAFAGAGLTSPGGLVERKPSVFHDGTLQLSRYEALTNIRKDYRLRDWSWTSMCSPTFAIQPAALPTWTSALTSSSTNTSPGSMAR